MSTRLNAASRLRASKVWRYAMVNRPIGIGCCPKEGLVGSEDRPASGKPHHDMARNGVALFDRKLSDAETKSFEMALMAEGEDLREVVEGVVEKMKRYAKPYVEMAADDLNDFKSEVHDKMKGAARGYPASVGDFDAFVQSVLTELKKY